MTRRSALLFALTASVRLYAAPPLPEAFFGFRMGTDRKLVTWQKTVAYFDALAATSDRVRVERIGPTVDGRQMIAAFIADAGTLRDLDRYRDIQARLADPRRTGEHQADALIASGKTVVMITCSIHSTEVASTMTAIEFAHRLVTRDSPKDRAILANTILILVPSLNPDGIDIVADWYAKTLGTAFEGTGPPELYQRYLGHDNNRDWYIFSQPETRNVVAALHNVWHPQIVYDVHQQGAYGSRMFVPPWMDPIDPNIDPIVAQLCNSVGTGMAADLTAAGKTGIAINAIYDFWSPSRAYQSYHGGLRILSESASARLATPVTVRPAEIDRTALGFNPRERTWNYLEPWMGGEWRVRNIVEYQMIAMESCLFQAATRREDFLRSFYEIGRRACERRTPAAFIIPARQRDAGATRKLLETLRFGALEIEQAVTAFRAGGEDFDAGTYVVRMQQPYSSWAKTLLERQDYPDLRLYPGGPPKRPYDVTAQTLPLLMGVDVRIVAQPFAAELRTADKFSFAVKPLTAEDSDTWREINKLWAAGSEVWRDPKTGDFQTVSAEGLQRVARPRIGLYRSWVPNIDEGWTRWLLEAFGFAYTSVRNQDLQAGGLGNRFDVIVFPDARPPVMRHGYAPGAMPEQYIGGVAEKGVQAIREFAEAGGTLIFLNEGCEYAVEELGTDVKSVLKSVPDREFFAPGSILNARAQAGPLTLGLPREIHIWSERSPAFEIPPASKARAVVTYPQERLLASGWLLGERHLRGRAALVDVPAGKGHIVLFGMRPQYRGQSYQTFKLFFNSLLYRAE